VWDREFGFLREMLVAPVRRSSIVLGKALGGATVATVQGVLVLVLAPFVDVPLSIGLALTLLGVPLGLARYASLGHRSGPRSFAVRSGWLVREHVVLQRRAVVGWEVRQSLFQRQAGLATVVACVGAGSGGYAAVDMAADEVGAFTAAASDGTWAGVLAP
jgi:putative membrane protein